MVIGRSRLRSGALARGSASLGSPAALLGVERGSRGGFLLGDEPAQGIPAVRPRRGHHGGGHRAGSDAPSAGDDAAPMGPATVSVKHILPSPHGRAHEPPRERRSFGRRRREVVLRADERGEEPVQPSGRALPLLVGHRGARQD